MDPDSWTQLFSLLPKNFQFTEKPDYFDENSARLEAALHRRISKNLTTYPIPKLSPEGVCSLPMEMEEKEFDLTPFFTRSVNTDLQPLYSVTTWLKEASEADWAGVYGIYDGPHVPALGEDHPPILLKLAYDGKPSRGWFPISADFAKRSNNVTSVLQGKVILINDVKAHLAAGGSYYECDPLVQSELCFPIYHEGRSVGLIDLEGLRKNQFNEKDVWLATLAAEKLAPLLARLPWQQKASASLKTKSVRASEELPAEERLASC
jgi:L-methionine (R)-S-oxide reductase